jgi:uncharacterized membrane protein YqgA involved in biofilm formation
VLKWIPPGLVVWTLLVLIASQLSYSFLPLRARYLPVLAVTAAGFLLGQGWQLIGLPSLHLGQANLLPGLIFAAGLQPLAPRLPIGRDRG